MSEIREYRVERRGGRGCLWGCLAVLAIVLAPLLFAWGYTAWLLNTGFRETPLIRTATEMMQRDGLAQRVMGAPIIVTGLEGNAFSYMPGTGIRNRYVLRLQGAKGEGTLEVASGATGAPSKVESMILTGPDGGRYDLLTDTPLPGSVGKPDDTI